MQRSTRLAPLPVEVFPADRSGPGKFTQSLAWFFEKLRQAPSLADRRDRRTADVINLRRWRLFTSRRCRLEMVASSFLLRLRLPLQKRFRRFESIHQAIFLVDDAHLRLLSLTEAVLCRSRLGLGGRIAVSSRRDFPCILGLLVRSWSLESKWASRSFSLGLVFAIACRAWNLQGRFDPQTAPFQGSSLAKQTWTPALHVYWTDPLKTSGGGQKIFGQNNPEETFLLRSVLSQKSWLVPNKSEAGLLTTLWPYLVCLAVLDVWSVTWVLGRKIKQLVRANTLTWHGSSVLCFPSLESSRNR